MPELSIIIHYYILLPTEKIFFWLLIVDLLKLEEILTMEDFVKFFFMFPEELQVLVISWSSIEWRSVSKKHKQIADKYLLFDSRFKFKKDDKYAILWASQNGYTEIVGLLLKYNKVDIFAKMENDPNVFDVSPMLLAIENNHIEVVKLLLKDDRFDPVVDNNYAIRKASEHGHVEVVKLLLQDPRVDPTVDNNYTIKYASKNGYVEVVKLLLQDSRF